MKKQAVGYVRVSSIEQTKGTSLESQREAIQKYAKEKGWELGEIYADEGISGADMEKRTDLLRLLRDAADGKFEIMICTDTDRFGRDMRDILNNRHILEQCGVEDHFTSTPNESRLGRNVRAVIAEEERLKIKERTMRGRLINLKKGSPQGRLPFNRVYDKETGEWGFEDENKNELIRWAASQYLGGRSLEDIASDLTKKGCKICRSNLNRVLSQGCGDRFINTLQGTLDGKKVKATYEHKIPWILDEAVIQAVRDRLDHNLCNNRKDVKKYVLTGFIRCELCEGSMSGQTIKSPTKHFKYYYHAHHQGKSCQPGFSQLPMEGIENAVFKALYRNTFDVESYREAVQESAPDDIQINTLKERIKYNEKRLKKIEAELDKLVEGFLSGTFKRKETIQKMESALTLEKEHVTEDLETHRRKLDSLGTLKQFEKDVKNTRKILLKRFQSAEHLERMTYRQKRRLLHYLFDGKDENGKHYGIYVWLKHKKNKHKKQFSFDIYARIFTGHGGFRSDDPEGLDIYEWAEKRRSEWSKKAGKHKQPDQRRKKPGKMKPRKRRKEYKTKSLSGNYFVTTILPQHMLF